MSALPKFTLAAIASLLLISCTSTGLYRDKQVPVPVESQIIDPNGVELHRDVVGDAI